MILTTKTSDQTRQRDTLSLLAHIYYLSCESLVLSSLLPCYSLDYLGWQLLNQPFFVYVFLLTPKSSPFVTSRLQLLSGFLRFFASPPPSPIPSSIPSSTPSRHCSRLRYYSRFRPRPVPVPILCSSTGLHPCSRSRPIPISVSILRSFDGLHPRSRSYSVLVPITVDVPVPTSDPVPVSVPAPNSDPAPDPVPSFPSLGLGYPLGMCVYVCVVIPFILDVRFVDVPTGVTQEEGHTGFLHLPSAVLSLIFLARRIQPFLSLVDRKVDFCVLTV